jgi:cytochrome c oxidase accessory protein FixG
MSALIDTHTLTVTYDRPRGEPRSRLHKGTIAASQAAGDCVDCGQCVTVCPTGIDIRNGIQLECVNCAACIDACDDVMRRLKRPTGLIRITSHEAVRTGRTEWLTARVKAYATIWLILVVAVGTLIARRPDVDVLILRQPGTMYTLLDDGAVANFYNVQVINRTNRPHALEYRVVSPAGATVTALGAIDRVDSHGLVESRLLVRVPRASLTGVNTPVSLEIRADGVPVQTLSSSLVGPDATAPHAARPEETR